MDLTLLSSQPVLSLQLVLSTGALSAPDPSHHVGIPPGSAGPNKHSHCFSPSLRLSQIAISLGTKKRYCQFEKPHYKIYLFHLMKNNLQQQLNLKLSNTGGILSWEWASQPTTTLHTPRNRIDRSNPSHQLRNVIFSNVISALMDTQFGKTFTLGPLNIHPAHTSMGTTGRRQPINPVTLCHQMDCAQSRQHLLCIVLAESVYPVFNIEVDIR